MVAVNMADHIFGHAFEPPKGPMGYSRVLTQSRRPHKTTDGYICLLAYTDPQWERFWAEVGRPELKDDRRFNSLSSREENIEEVYRLAGDFIRKRTTSEWLEVLPRLEIPCGEIVELDSSSVYSYQTEGSYATFLRRRAERLAAAAEAARARTPERGRSQKRAAAAA